MAIAVLAVGSVGALVGVSAADLSLREGQLRIYKQTLIDASLQRVRLQNKEQLFNSAVTYNIATAAALPNKIALGTAPWALDTSVSSATPPRVDLSAGSLFIVLPNGTITPCTSTSSPACTTAPSNCADYANIPRNVFCREVAFTRTGAAVGTNASALQGTVPVTAWVRVVQRKATTVESDASAVVGWEVFAK